MEKEWKHEASLISPAQLMEVERAGEILPGGKTSSCCPQVELDSGSLESCNFSCS